jgi:hypothetical protein
VTDAPAVQRAIAAAMRRAVAGAITVDEAVSEAMAAVVDRQESSTPAERLAQESALYLAEFDRLGAGRDAASKVGRRFSAGDPQAAYRIAQRTRDLARARARKVQALHLAV